jgi:hypothetical protein
MLNLETQAQPIAVQSMRIPEGDPGTEATIAQMRRLVAEGKKDPVVHELAAKLVNKNRPHDRLADARAIYTWALRNIRFTPDVRGIETLHSAREILHLGIGDCDDFTILICALAATIGFRCRIVTVSADPRAPEIFSHVYPELNVGGRWIALDAARRNAAFGRTPARYYRKRVWDVSSPEYQDVAGLGMMPLPARRAAGVAMQMPPVPPPAPNQRRATNRLRREGYRLRGLRGGRGLRGMGIDPGDITGLIQAGAAGAAQIIGASRAAPYNIFPGTGGSPAPFSQIYAQTQQPTGLFGLSTSTLLLLVVGVGLAFAAGRR